ncbi:ATP-binding cassette domain-containing protein [Tissierella sp. Yu-01]|uniref:ATP-binding cassette domain-containing protein n=1 Tax=Tissierella sp. Yu-01 TaxID=3035694 RepID=UPI00240D3992|nr:ATP-binding cassette domain-containing protein [Tissierella sp. Yu-01]WFA08184.1 ATP-binding cassette domain-containing protein [Tissierella sp. Yu-01]
MELNIENLHKKYGDKAILDIPLLTVEEGKITGITGPNGSGKSTLLNTISGIDRDFHGKVSYNGEPLNKDVARNMTYVFQKPYLFRRKVYDNIAYPLKLRKIHKDKIKELVDEVIKRLEIADLIDKRGHQLSGGESQKVALARALVFRPKLLLLDEPTSNIDPESIKVLEREIVRFNEETKGTVLIVTHNLDQAQRICNDIIYLNFGRVSD